MKKTPGNRKSSHWRRQAFSLLFLLYIGLAGCSQGNQPLILSGRVTEPYSQKGIPGVYVSFLGVHATGFMGGTEYLDDLLLDSTDAEGKFRLQVPAATIDSFARENGFLSIYRFGLEARSMRSGHGGSPYQGYNITVRQLSIDTGFNFFDRNDIDRHTLILTGKNERVKKDMEGVVIKLYRGAALRLFTGDDPDYANGKLVHMTVQELERSGKIRKEDNFYLDKPSLENKLLLKPYTPVNIILSKWTPRDAGKEDTLTVLRNLQLPPGVVKEIRLKSGK
jgi:hypothetical protein